MRHTSIILFMTAAFAGFPVCNSAQQKPAGRAPDYLRLSTPRIVLENAQAWEGSEFPHTLSVVERNRGGYRYWGWYGLNEGGGVGLARSNDLLHWVKYEQNPLWTNARWPSVLSDKNEKNTELLYFAITRDYDTPASYIVLARSRDGLHLEEEKVLVAKVPNQRNQNPNLFRDPRSGRFFLTFYRGDDHEHFEIVAKSAASVRELDSAPEKVLLSSSTTIAAPTLLYVAGKHQGSRGIYYLATEIYPGRYSGSPEGEWQVQVYAADAPDGEFRPVRDNPVLAGQRACLFQHVFHNRFYGYDCHLQTTDKWVLEEVEAPLP